MTRTGLRAFPERRPVRVVTGGGAMIGDPRIPLLQAPIRRWWCPNCTHTDVTREANPHTRFHYCPKLGLDAPMVPYGTSAKVESVEREDYIGDEDVQYNDRARPIMAVITTRDDGNDAVVYAPTARGSLG